MRESLIPAMKTTFNHVLNTGMTPPSWREAVITLIPKEGKDKTECENYRAISVLNQDYKIFTRIIAKRTEEILPQIISLDQTGLNPRRQTQDNIRRTLHLIEQITGTQQQVVCLGLDAEKAFDRVNWDFLHKILNKFRIHEKCVKTIQALSKGKNKN